MVRTREDIWDTVEERERQIELLMQPGGARRLFERQHPTSLQDEGARQDPCSFTTRDLREMVRVYDTPVVSLYLNPAPKHPPAPRYPMTVFHSLRHQELEARRDWVESLGHDARVLLRNDLDAVERFLEEYAVPAETEARCLVVLKSGVELNRAMTLPVRTRDRLTIDLDPYVVPLEQMLERERRVLVVEVSHEDARFRVHCLGRQEQIDHCRSFVPSVTVDRSRPGKVQRHRMTHFQWHLRGVAQATSRLLEERQCDAVVLAGDETVLGTLEELLPRDVEQRIIGSFHPDPDGARSLGYWEREVEEILARRRAEEEEEALRALPDAEAQGLLVSGLPAVLDAVNVFMVRRLFVAEGTDQPGWVCREHHFLALEGGRCPFCDRELLPVDSVVDELVEIARLHGVELMLVERAGDRLAPYEGIAAVTYPRG